MKSAKNKNNPYAGTLSKNRKWLCGFSPPKSSIKKKAAAETAAFLFE